MKKIFILFIIGLLFSSCQEDFPVEYTETYEMAREWFVTNTYGGTNIDAVRKLITYNTTENVNTLLWIDASGDHGAAQPYNRAKRRRYFQT